MHRCDPFGDLHRKHRAALRLKVTGWCSAIVAGVVLACWLVGRMR